MRTHVTHQTSFSLHSRIRDIPVAPKVSRTLKDWARKGPRSNLNLVFPSRALRVQNYAKNYNRIFKPMLIENGIVDDQGNGTIAPGHHF